MRKILVSSVLAVGLSFNASAADVIELNLGHVASPDGHHYQVYAEHMAEIVAKESGGKLKINIFPSGQLGGEVKLIQSARSGALPLVITAEPPLENTVREYGVFSLPYLLPDLDGANKALQGPFGDHMLSYLEKHGLVGLAWISPQERNIFGNVRVQKPADMQGVKTRVIQSPGYVSAYESLGAQATPMAYGELYLALQTGVIDAGETSPDLMIKDKFAEVSKYYSMVKIHYMPCILLMSQRVLDKLSPEHQELIRRAAKEAIPSSIDTYKQSYTDSIQEMKKMGLEIIDADIPQFRQVTQNAFDSLLADIPDGKSNVEKARAAAQ